MPRRALPLVGRDAERSTLTGLLTVAEEGAGRTAVVVGGPGLGKTRLVRDVVVEARERGFRVIRGRCHQGEEAIPLAPIRRRLGRPDDDLPGAGRLRSLLAGDRDDLSRLMLVEAAADLVVGLVDPAVPVLLVVEDLHWMDPESRRVLMAVVSRCADRPVLIVCTTRPGTGRGPVPGLDQHRMPVVTVTLSRLSPQQVTELVTVAAGGRPGPRLRRQADRCDGNPFFLTELLEELHRRGSLRLDEGVAEVDAAARPVPRTLTQHVRDRMAEFDDHQRQITRFAALSAVNVPLLASLQRRPISEVVDSVETLLIDGMLTQDGDEWLHLRHDMIRDVLVAGMSPPIQAALHTALARALLAAGADRTLVAPHLVRSLDADDPVMRDTMADVGRELARLSPTLAVPLLQRAAAAGVDDVVPDLVTSLVLTGNVPATETVLHRWPDGPDAPLKRPQRDLVQAQLRFLRGDLNRAVTELLAVADAAWDEWGVDGAAPQDLASALPDGGDGPRPDRGLMLARAHAAACLMFQGHLDSARDVALHVGREHAVCRRNPRGGSTAAVATALLVRACVAAMRAEMAKADSLVRAGRRLAESVDAYTADPDYFVGMTLFWGDRLEDARQALHRGLDRVRTVGTGWQYASLHAGLAWTLVRSGDWADAEGHAETGLVMAEDHGVNHGVPWCVGVQTFLAVGRGDAAKPLLGRLQDSVKAVSGQGAGMTMWIRGLLALTSGDTAYAARVLGLLWERLSAGGVALRQLHMGPDLARAARVHDHTRLRAIAAWAQGDVARTAPQRAASLAAHTTGLLADDPDRVVAAADLLRDLGDRIGEARALADAVVLPGLASRDRIDVAVRGAEILRPVGAHAWAAPFMEVLAETPGHATDRRTVGGQHRRPSSGWGSLTPSEDRIVRLVAEGLGNRQIADRLSVSPRTVESHLHHAYAKLDVSSRVELAIAGAAFFGRPDVSGPGQADV